MMPLFPLFAAALVGAIYTFARILVGPWAGLVVAAAVAVAPRSAYEASTACADVPLGAYNAVLIGTGIWMLRSPHRSKLFLMAVMAAGALFTKSEGTVNAGIACAVFLVAYLVRTRSPRATGVAVAVLAIGLAVSLPWLAFRQTIPQASFTSSQYVRDVLNFRETVTLENVKTVTGMMGRQLSINRHYGVLWLVIAAAVVLFPKRLVKAESAVLLAFLLLNLLVYTLVFLVIHPPLTPLIMARGQFPRLLNHLIGPAALLLALQWFPFRSVPKSTAARYRDGVTT